MTAATALGLKVIRPDGTTAGLGGSISILWYDPKQARWRRKVAEVDGKRVKAGVAYRVVDGKLVEAK